MDKEKMRYPFGRCISCGMEFSRDLREKYNITHCPLCGVEIDDFLKPDNQIEHPDDIYCEECGQRIFERFGKNNEGGNWIEGDYEDGPGVCSGLCERELCGNCADWDVNGECVKCRNSPCGQCPNHNALDVCKQCDHFKERELWPDMEGKTFYEESDEHDDDCSHCANNCDDEEVCESCEYKNE